MSRLKDLYYNEIVDAMVKKFGYKNKMEVPKIDKIVVNMGVGEAKCKDFRVCGEGYGNHNRTESNSYES